MASTKNLEALAHHEAAHAAAAVLHGLPLASVSIEGAGHATFAVPRGPEIYDAALAMLAGGAAQAVLVGGDGWDYVSRSDLQAVEGLARVLGCDPEDLLSDGMGRAVQWVGMPHNWRAVEAVARRLLAVGKLSGAEVKRILAR